MAIEKRIKILAYSEITNLFDPAILNINDQRFFFALNDAELAECKKIRDRSQRCMFVVQLGYFKVKPIILSPAYHQVKHDLKYIYQTVLPGLGLRPFSMDQKAKDRLYRRILCLCGHERWDEKLIYPLCRDTWRTGSCVALPPPSV